MLGKKGQVATILIIVLIVVLVIWVVNFGRRECRTDRNCGKEYYCGSDFQCHEKEKIAVKSNDFLFPSLIIAVALIISAVILRFKFGRKKEPEAPQQEQEEQSSNDFKYY